MEAIMRTNTTNTEIQSKLIELAKRQQDMLLKQQEQIDKLEERIAALEERLAIYESNEKPDDEEIIVYHRPEEETIGYHCDIWKIDRACEHICISNPIADMYGFPIGDLTDDTIMHLDIIRGMMRKLDKSGKKDYGDILIEAIIELNSLLSILGR
jgi:hypothetical protein